MAQWFFPKLGGGEEHGLNDAGIETFKKEDSLARETCQNIGDVWNRSSGEPAIATFELVDLPSSEFPGKDELISILSACKEYVLDGLPDGTGNESRFFTNAIKVLNRKTIPMLRIGDENTLGLRGGDSDRREPFFRLLKGQGSSSLQGDGGGTYGIGQRAPFAHSALRTVFYSTKTPSGVAFIAKSILASFPSPTDGQMTQSKGWWCNSSSDESSWSTIRNKQEIPTRFLRSKVGTDLWLAGFQTENWEQSVRHSVLRHFFAAIENKQLVIRLAKDGRTITEITADNLAEQLIKAADEAKASQPKHEYNTGLGSTLYFHKAIVSPTGGKPFKTTIDKLGEVSLYVFRDVNNKDMPDRWATMRKPRIIVEHFGSGILNRFAAVLICDSKDGNKYLSQLEGPEHNRWHQEETRQWSPKQKKEAQNIIADIRRFVRDTLKEVRGASMAEVQDVPFLGRYLPAEDDEDDELASGSGESQAKDDSETESGPRKSEDKRETVNGIAHKQAPPKVDSSTKTGDPTTGEESEGATDNEPNTTTEGNGSPIGVRDEGDRVLSPQDVRFRAYRSGSEYKVVLESQEDITGKLRLRAVGESSRFDVEIASAVDEQENTNLEVSQSTIRAIVLKARTKRIIRVSINSDSDLVLSMET